LNPAGFIAYLKEDNQTCAREEIMKQSIYDFSATTIELFNRPLSEYKGKVLLIVNTASKCGFTPQLKGLQDLYEKYSKNGFEILAFPCNQFMEQEPGNEKEIKNFCETTYNTTFQIFSKIDVKGPDQHPLYAYLTVNAPGIFGSKKIKWNFTKFLIDRNGKIIRRYAPATKPENLEKDIIRLL